MAIPPALVSRQAIGIESVANAMTRGLKYILHQSKISHNASILINILYRQPQVRADKITL